MTDSMVSVWTGIETSKIMLSVDLLVRFDLFYQYKTCFDLNIYSKNTNYKRSEDRPAS